MIGTVGVMRSLQSSAVLLTLTSLGLGQEVYRRSECSHDSQVSLYISGADY